MLKDLRRHIMMQQAGSILPPEYQQVEYVGASDSGSYIDVGVTIGASSEIYVKFMVTSASESPYHTDIFGFSGAGANYLIRYESRSTYPSIWRTGGSHVSLGIKYSIGFNYIYEAIINENNNSKAIVNNIDIGAIPNNGSVPTYRCFLMASYGIANGRPYASGCQRIYSFIIRENGSEIRNMIPCYRKSDREVGMYDVINGIFYTNAGTGTFTYG